ncbi:glutamate acetyltransferase [Rhizobium leguminosarum]|uniref:glutamate acetyltransferase n=1 Tax=Rhizobium leguminosarum TaxID=384 RepID=UPI0021BBD6EC|nr:glutamate acetyltransferase [Rhizobium leguminosarum]
MAAIQRKNASLIGNPGGSPKVCNSIHPIGSVISAALRKGIGMNPFARTAAALFLVNGPKSNSPLDAEKICSALIQTLLEDASRNLEARAWQNAVQTVPYQLGKMKLPQTLNCTMPLGGLPDKLASMCTSESQRPTLAKSIGSYLKQFGKPTAFNCLILDQSDTAEIHLSLTCLDVTEDRNPEKFSIASTQVSAKLKLSNQQTQAAITEAFGSFQATSDQPFYLRTELIQMPTKSSSMEDIRTRCSGRT